MNNTEKKLINSICETLNKSSIPSWTSGDLEDWSEYAKNMRTTIKNSTATLTTLTDAENIPNTSELNQHLDNIKTQLLNEEHVPNEVLVEIEILRFKLNKLV